jgi:hypothetical protein
MRPERLARVLLIVLVAEWLYISGYIGVGLLWRFLPVFAAHGAQLWAVPQEILLSTLCLLALIVGGACTIVAVRRGAWARARTLLLVEAVLMVILPLSWGWLLYGIIEGSYFVSYAVSGRSWETLRQALPWLPVVAYPLVVLSKPLLALAALSRN